MAAVGSLREVAEEMDMLMEGCHSFLNRRTGEIYGGTDECLAAAEDDDDDVLGWQQPIVVRLREIIASDDWIELPRRNPIEDHRLLVRFCLERTMGEEQEELLATIKGRGAFRRFKDMVIEFDIEDKWHRFRDEAMIQEAAEWLQFKGIAYRE